MPDKAVLMYPGVVETPSPLLGEHNREIFGLTEEEEAQLKEEGVI